MASPVPPRRERHALWMACTAFTLTALVLGGCGGGAAERTAEGDAPLHETSDAAFRSAEGTRAQALRALDSLRRGALRGAFEQLRGFGYRRRMRTEQRAGRGRVVASEERTVRHAPGDGGTAQVLRSDSSGSFDFGALGNFASTDTGAPAADLAQQVFSEEPAFLSKRNRHAFQYRLLPDTSLAGGVGPARVVAVRARASTDGQKQALRRARLYLDADTRQLVALRLHRVRQSMLFSEDTRQFVRLRRAPAADSAGWVPAQTRFETWLDMPLRPARRFRSTATYDQYRPAPS